MKAIIAKNKLGYIGIDGELPWKSKEDLKHFKELTMGGKLLVGYTTAQKLPTLFGREVIVDDENCRRCLVEYRPEFFEFLFGFYAVGNVHRNAHVPGFVTIGIKKRRNTCVVNNSVYLNNIAADFFFQHFSDSFFHNVTSH